jgi:1-acyl-sn-glycerol-3-phosphate acyltransferase
MTYYASREILRLFLKLVGRLRVVGADNVPKSGGVILAPNHISDLDPPTAGMGTSRLVHFMAKEELFHSRFMATWMRSVGTFPVRRGSADRRAIKQVLDYLEHGEVVCVFPEGTRSPDGKLQHAELGIGMFALKSRAAVVPVAITGTNKVFPPHGKRLHFRQITVEYGKPLTFPDLYDLKESRESYGEVGRRVISAIAEMQSEVTR